MEVGEVADPGEPGPGQVLVRPEAVGICGSDLHFFTGELATPPAFGSQYPRVQGHEFAGVVEALGPGGPPGLAVGQRVAVHPLSSCGRCRACRIGRPNACPYFRLVGVHVDGALAERVTVAAGQVFDVGDLPPVLGAFCEPMSIAVRALVRGAVAGGDPVVVLGAGPIGQAVTIGALDRGARVLITDVVADRLAPAAAAGADVLRADEADVVAAARDWAGDEGPAVVVDCTGQPSAIADAVTMVSPAGRVVVVGISHDEVALPVNAFTRKELDLLGSTVCTRADFAEAVQLVGRHRAQVERLVTHQVPLPEAPAAVENALRRPGDVMKLVIRVDAA
ncbi:zinc-binding alcohol dehydrogenase family protein [Pseudonocardia adelaidensis]|uniref:Zinc-binding alcohol dehydrogenase family protein n=2 Tax=Pseudonocardia adelaidensis TaxID=648754 RepID=A0ABP9NP42_9PSEU